MKAAVCREFGKPLTIEDLEAASPGAGEVQVRIRACAICHSDIIYMDGGWGGTLPAVYGHEAAGVVEKVGEGVGGIDVGDHVVVTLIRSCGECHYCAQGHAVMCDTTFPLDKNSPLTGADGKPVVQGLRTGAFAEVATVDASQVAVIPKDVPLESASLLACGVITGLGAVTNTARVPAGSDVAVIGTGGVGLNSVQGAVLCGARRIVAVDLSPDKLEAARTFGATHVVNGSDADAVEQITAITDGRGVDFAFVTVGALPAIEQGYKLIKRGGSVVIVGMTPVGVTSSFDPLDLADQSKRIVGSKMGATRVKVDIPQLVDLYRQGRLKLDELISGRYPIDRINEAIDSVRRGEALRNVITF